MKKEKFTTNLTESETERLAILAEECAEVQQVIMKILRHGYGSHNPFDEDKTPNRQLLNKELGDLLNAVDLLGECHDINVKAIDQYKWEKRKKIQKYLHFNSIPPLSTT